MHRIWNKLVMAQFYIYWPDGGQFRIKYKEWWKETAVPLSFRDDKLDTSNSGGFRYTTMEVKLLSWASKKITKPSSHTAVVAVRIRNGCIPLEAPPLETSVYTIYCCYCTMQLVTERFRSWGVTSNLAEKCQRPPKQASWEKVFTSRENRLLFIS
jgi:hypothetical protein